MFVFVHIPKTAGTSVTNALTAIFGKHRILRPPPGDNRVIRHSSRSELAAYHCVSAHMALPDLRKKCGPAHYFTVVREPVERMVSFFRHVLRDERHRDYAVASTEGIIGWLEWLQRSDDTWLPMSQNYYIGESLSVESVKTACAAIDIGDQRDIEPLLRIIARKASKPMPEVKRLNIAQPHQYTPTESHLREINRLFSADIEAYHWLHSSGRVLVRRGGADETAAAVRSSHSTHIPRSTISS